MDISSLRERRASSEMTVSELNLYIKRVFDNDRLLSALTVRGEISNFTYHKSGHLYFSLKDEGGQVKAIMFRSSAAGLKFMPENGMKVIVRCSVSVYTQTGAYQLYVSSMQPDGIGALYLAYEQLKSRLEAEGLFDEEHKRPIPAFPERIGVITSPTGAAVRDIINVTGRRYPVGKIYLYPSLVQGEGAEANLIEALDYFNSSRLVDVIIIGRGGGSIEDLWAFNGEALARKIYEVDIPVISAVGHETDFTICDFVSDLRAPTPSAAAEIAVPDVKELYVRLMNTYDRCAGALVLKTERMEQKLGRIKDNSIFSSPERLFAERESALEEMIKECSSQIVRVIENAEHKLAVKAGTLNALSPLTTLARGYAVVTGAGGTVKKAEDVNIGDRVGVRLSDGKLIAEVVEREKV